MWDCLDEATTGLPLPDQSTIEAEIATNLARLAPQMREAVERSYRGNTPAYWRDCLARERAIHLAFDAIDAKPAARAHPTAQLKLLTDFAEAVVMREQTRRDFGSLPPATPDKGRPLICNN